MLRKNSPRSIAGRGGLWPLIGLDWGMNPKTSRPVAIQKRIFGLLLRCLRQELSYRLGLLTQRRLLIRPKLGSTSQFDGSNPLIPPQKACKNQPDIGGADRVSKEGVGKRRVKTSVRVRCRTLMNKRRSSVSKAKFIKLRLGAPQFLLAEALFVDFRQWSGVLDGLDLVYV